MRHTKLNKVLFNSKEDVSDDLQLGPTKSDPQP